MAFGTGKREGHNIIIINVLEVITYFYYEIIYINFYSYIILVYVCIVYNVVEKPMGYNKRLLIISYNVCVNKTS